MNKIVFRLVATLFIGTSVLALNTGTAQAADLCVNPGGTDGCYSTIQAAIDAATVGQTIRVKSGTYQGGVLVNKAGLLLLGDGTAGTVKIVPSSTANRNQAPTVKAVGSTPIKPDLRLMGVRPSSTRTEALKAAAADTFGFTVIADNVVIKNFDISGFAGIHDASGIFVGGLFAGDTANPANNVKIRKNQIHDNGNGIYLWQTSNATVSNNIISNSKDYDGVEGVGILSFAGFGDAEVSQANANGRSGKNNLISYNTLFKNDRLAIFAGACTEVALGCNGPTGIHADITGTIIEQNTAYQNGADASLGGANGTEAIGLLDAHAGTVRYNLAYTDAFFGMLVNYSDESRLQLNQSNRNGAQTTAYAGIRVNQSDNIHLFKNTTKRNPIGIHITASTTSFAKYNTATFNNVVDLNWDQFSTLTVYNNTCLTAIPSRKIWDCH